MPALSHVASTRAVPSPGRRGLWMVLMLSLAACATAAPTPKALPHAPMDAVLADAVGPEGYLGAVAVVAERGTVVYRGVFGHADLQGRHPLREQLGCERWS